MAMATTFRPANLHSHLGGALPDIGERAPLDVLDHGERLAVLVGGRFQDLRHARVIQLRLHAGLVEKASEKRAVVNVIAPHRLHDARALRAFEPRRGCEVDVAHSAAGQELQEDQPAHDAGQRVGRRRRPRPEVKPRLLADRLQR